MGLIKDRLDREKAGIAPETATINNDVKPRFQPFNISKGLIRGCASPNCSKTVELFRCSICNAVSYCSLEHQSTDRPAHRSICTKIKKAYAHFEKEEKALKREHGDDFPDEDMGQDEIIDATREYMPARFSLVNTLMRINTTEAVEQCLTHCLAMLEMCQFDPMHVHEVIPVLYLRLGRDQESFSFIVWWAMEGERLCYKYPEGYLPPIRMRIANAFVDFGPIVENTYLSAVVTTTLIKIRIMMDLQWLDLAKRDIGPRVPREILDIILENCPSSAITRRPEILKLQDYSAQLADLKSQVRRLFAAVNKKNAYFWAALVDPKEEDLTTMHTLYKQDGRDGMQIVLQYNYNAWVETPGAIGVIEELLKERVKALT